MSEQQNNGQRRNQGGNRNNNRNNNNRNNNRNRSNNNRSNNNRTQKKSAPKPLVLTGWQKFLKMIGLFNEEKARKAHEQAEKVNKSLNQKSKPSHKREAESNGKAAAKPNNTRNAKPRRAPEKVPVETPRLYVGNLSYDASDSDIEELFKGIGNVKNVEIIYNRHTHRSKGYGFVQMFNTDDAKRAVEVLHDQPFLGRNLIVNGSKARNPDDPAAKQNEETADTSAA